MQLCSRPFVTCARLDVYTAGTREMCKGTCMPICRAVCVWCGKRRQQRIFQYIFNSFRYLIAIPSFRRTVRTKSWDMSSVLKSHWDEANTCELRLSQTEKPYGRNEVPANLHTIFTVENLNAEHMGRLLHTMQCFEAFVQCTSAG